MSGLKPERAVRFATLKQRLARLAPNYRVIGFDVFDTLLLREVDGEWLKTAVSRRAWERLCSLLGRGNSPSPDEIRQKRSEIELAIARERMAAGGDNEADYEELLPRWIGLWVSSQEHRSQLCNDIRDFELRLERQVLRPAPGIRDTLEMLKGLGKRLVFVSDMYHGATVLRQLLAASDLDGYFAAGYASTDYGLRKATGRLFERVLQLERVKASDFLFVGDNPLSDDQQPRRMGIRSVLVVDPAETRRKLRLQTAHWAFRRNPQYWAWPLVAESLRTLHAEQDDTDINVATGRLLAPAFFTFVLWVIERCEALNISRVYFIAREGLLFQRILDTMRRRGIRHAGRLKARYLFLSRASTMLASMEQLSWAEIYRFWRQYDRQSLRDLLRNLSLPEEPFFSLAAEVGLTDPDVPILEPESHQGFQMFLHSQRVHAEFQVHRNRARDALVQYLRQHGIFEERRVAFVDIGWKGSIQDNVALAIKSEPRGPEIYGLYFGYVATRAEDLERSYKEGFMADSRHESFEENDLFRNISMFEMAATANHGSTVGYRSAPGRPNTMVPLLKQHAIEREHHRRSFTAMQKAIIERSRQCADLNDLFPFTSGELKPGLLAELLRFIRYPTAAEAREFLRYSHVESFGRNEVTTYGFRWKPWKALRAGGPHAMAKELLRSLESNPWSEAVVRRSRLPGLPFLFDLFHGLRRS